MVGVFLTMFYYFLTIVVVVVVGGGVGVWGFLNCYAIADSFLSIQFGYKQLVNT